MKLHNVRLHIVHKNIWRPTSSDDDDRVSSHLIIAHRGQVLEIPAQLDSGAPTSAFNDHS
jgi:hypothetical protein